MSNSNLLMDPDKEIAEDDSSRARIVAFAVREACAIAYKGQSQQNWESACNVIMQNNLLTDTEKATVIALLQRKTIPSDKTS
ncbi:sequence orphan [Gigaspora margarita]|uniref:Sequence orphan n=2 Tax=Gigaspora margarita TaxID=4874 RepID=A0A8H3X8V4_GIGMA|nr:sequence orphan [Gigaspora margarita]